MSLTDSAAELQRTLHERFGLERFRPGQREVIENVLKGRDVLCVMPTGGGKSLCYQLPAVILRGITLVVSPLIALMKDQVDALTQRGVRATLINSTLDPAVQHARILEVEAGRYDLVYVAPERFRSGRFVEMIARVRPALLAVDEAHCISEWGHDFRPDYSRIGWARKKLGSPTCIALTATATDLVRRDIADQLDLRDPALFVTGFDRPNLVYSVVEAHVDPLKQIELAKILDENHGSAIVYASSRARCEEVAGFVRRELRRETVIYHAGLTREQRHTAQERFMSGRAEVVVATNAFGMGVDKAEIRAVVHYNMPGTLEAYYQEAGRAGRDGKPAQCVLLYAPGDRKLQELFIENEYPPPELVFDVFEFLREIDTDPIELTQSEIKSDLGIRLGESAVGTALRLLEGAGALEQFLPRENMAIVRINRDDDEPGSLVDRLGPQAHVQRNVLLGLEGLVNGRFAESIYFHPDDFAARLGIDRPALARALKALTSDLPIDYVPPFRGNAIRINDRKRRARDLDIDFATHRARKRREYEKLEKMVQYAQTDRCRRAYLLGYFGDPDAARVHCGHCDNCGDRNDTLAAAQHAPAIDTAAGREVVLKVLSGVARAKGRFGKTIVAQMLIGSTSGKMDQFGLKSLSTFGLLRDFRRQELFVIFDALAVAGYLESPEVDRFRPVLNLTDKGRALLKSRASEAIELALPDELLAKIRMAGTDRPVESQDTHTRAGDREERRDQPVGVARESETLEPPLPALDDPLAERLKALRLELAREAVKPAYCIFSNETLFELVRTRPRSVEALARVKGLGPVRLELYGGVLLETIASGDGLVSIASTAPPEQLNPPASRGMAGPTPERTALSTPTPTRSGPAAPGRASKYVPTEDWTWRLLDRGFNLEEAAAIRGLDRAAVIRHATLAAREGKPIRPEAILDAETFQQWDKWRIDHGDAPPPPELCNGVPGAADLWALFLACRRR
jgi:ATP-dependent DNA helicase RecQ